jgi:DNA-binding transcriptional LysR family regulator
MEGTIDLERVALFLTVAESAGFSAAAKKLGLPKSSVSRQVAALEAALGAQLLHRTTRRVSLSTAGEALYERAAPLVVALRAALGSLPEQEEQPSGDLRITAPNDVGATLLGDVVARFSARFPAVRIDLRLTNRAVDLVAEGFDLALRAAARPLRDSTLVMRKLGAIEMQLFAAPSYLARRGTPRAIEDLARHAVVLFQGFSKRPSLAAVAPGARIVGDDFSFVREAVKAGGGVGLMPSFLAQAELASGQLVRVLPRYVESGGALLLLHPRAKHVPRKVTAFRDFLLEYLVARPLPAREG